MVIDVTIAQSGQSLGMHAAALRSGRQKASGATGVAESFAGFSRDPEGRLPLEGAGWDSGPHSFHALPFLAGPLERLSFSRPTPFTVVLQGYLE